MTDVPSESRYRVPDNIAWIDGAEYGMAEELYLTIVPDGRTVLLEETARLIWLVAASGAEDVAAAVAGAVGLSADSIEHDVNTFLSDVTRRGLLGLEP